MTQHTPAPLGGEGCGEGASPGEPQLRPDPPSVHAVSSDTVRADAGSAGATPSNATAAHATLAPGTAAAAPASVPEAAVDASTAPEPAAGPPPGVVAVPEAAPAASPAPGPAAEPAATPAAAPEPEPDEESLRLAEALVFASAGPVSARALTQLLPDTADADAVIAALRERYAGRGVELVETAGGVQFRTAPELAPRLRKVIEVPRKLPRVAMETLAIIAYHQPCTRPEIEEIRGTSLSQQTLDALLEANLVAPKGRREVPGRPTLWGTTPQFLAQFGLKDIRDLPQRTDLLLETPQPSGVSNAPPLTSNLSAAQPELDPHPGQNPRPDETRHPDESREPDQSREPAASGEPEASWHRGERAEPGESAEPTAESNPAPNHDGAPLSRG